VNFINDSLAKENNIPHILYLLKSAIAKEEKRLLVEQNAYLYFHELKKLKECKDFLTIQNMKAVVKICNSILENALNSNLILIKNWSITKKRDLFRVSKFRIRVQVQGYKRENTENLNKNPTKNKTNS
jgi:hypothetical protein